MIMMKLSREIIDKHNDTHEDFEYYKTIIEEIEDNIASNPDISIESCKSLIEGICKSILLRINTSMTRTKVNKFDVQALFKKCCNYLGKNIPLEQEFIYQGFNLVKRIAELRNERGDISHGKSSPKAILSTKESAKMVMGVTDSIVHYMLDHFFRIDLSFKDEINYDDNSDFNDVLDDLYPDLGISYSMALYNQDYVSYEEELRDYEDSQEIEDE